MSRLITALLAALEAVVAALVGLGIALVPLILLWSVHFGLEIDLAVFLRAGADVWLVGHGVDLVAQLDPVTAARTGVAGAGDPFPITIAFLGFALVTVLFARRIGRRSQAAGFAITGCLSAAAVTGGIGLALSFVASVPAATTSHWQAALLPALVAALGAVIGAIYETLASEADGGDDAPGPLLARWRELPVPPLAGALASIRVGAGAAFGVIAVAAVLLAGLLAADYATIVGLSQSLGAGADGGLAITLAELALVPNAIVWAASWILGPGFAIGDGTTFSPMGTLAGPVPGLPLLGILPTGGAALGIVWLIVPIVFGFVGATFAWPRFEAQTGSRAHAWYTPVVQALGAGVVAGVVLGLLAWWSGGAVGPGRLAVVGPDPIAVGAIAAATVGFGAIAGAFTARAMPRGADGGVRGDGRVEHSEEPYPEASIHF
ncbi:hypothetical protein ET445_07595 [Agromyces protaetiae]|uniref:Uncharacterized protein n=1 Tax=Agromyces protaetiae TaxID=2509455 RepID=A0A4V0YH25_9MICO|nr:DUF6350 family protein [Agromyces protaetiae]QAY73231.1 hypothetical protein ET445_07595 [Agromyces protaetiae]